MGNWSGESFRLYVVTHTHTHARTSTPHAYIHLGNYILSSHHVAPPTHPLLLFFN